MISLCGMLATAKEDTLVLQDMDGILPLTFPVDLTIVQIIFEHYLISFVRNNLWLQEFSMTVVLWSFRVN